MINENGGALSMGMRRCEGASFLGSYYNMIACGLIISWPGIR
jgi:hypothetical protein